MGMMVALVPDDFDRLTLRRMRAWHRVLARFRAASLDRELADGADPEECAYLAARAQQLTSARSRQNLAAGLGRIMSAETGEPGEPDEPGEPGRIGKRKRSVPIRRARVARAAAELGALAGYLLAPGPVPARGVAMVRQLLSDGAGPLYQESCRVDLRELAQRAADALAR